MKFIKTPVKGMCDMLPSDMRLREYVLGMIKDSYAKYGKEIFKTLLTFSHRCGIMISNSNPGSRSGELTC